MVPNTKGNLNRKNANMEDVVYNENVKRTFLTSLLAIVLIFQIFASDNGQRIWATDDPIYKDIQTIFILSGKALPSSTGPWSTAELRLMMEGVSRSIEPDLYDSIMERLKGDTDIAFGKHVEMDFNLILALTGYARTDTDFVWTYDEFDNYLFRIQNEKPSVFANWETWVGNSLYSFTQYELKNENCLDDKYFYDYNFNFDIAGLCPEGFTTELDINLPYRAFLAAGGNYWSLQIGRDRLIAGNGETGNLILSGNFRFHDLLRFTMFGDRYKYTFLMSFMAHPVNCGAYSYFNPANKNSTSYTSGLFYYMFHRVEGRFLNDRLSMAGTESIVFQSEEGVFDPRYINPFALFHSYWIKGNANSMLGFEFSFAITKGMVIYGQMCMDDLATPKENTGDGDDTPNALGYMLGIKTRHILGKGILDFSAEAVYTDTYLYLRSIEGVNQNSGEYGPAYIGYYRSNDDPSYVWRFIGYPYGGDAIVGDLKLSYSMMSKFEVNAEYFMMLHGEKNIRSLFQIGTDERTPSGKATFSSYLQLSGKYYLRRNIDIFAQYNLVTSGDGRDNQFVLGIEARL